ncbi:MAG TPA: hypothetical protein VFC63_24860, partial [Blastocatellia bacterium]|nr:hypothetical protein [Blastocatellia bacterium]
MLDKLQDMLFPNKRRAMAATEELMQAIEHLFDELAREFNMTAAHEPLMLSLQRPSQACTTNDTKPVSSDAITSANQIEPRASANQIEPQENFQRLIVSTSFWALSVKGMEGTVDCFLLPSTELTNLPNAETASRSKLRLTYDERTKVWNMDTLPVSESELNTLCR